MLVYIGIPHDWITHDEGLVISVVRDRHAQMAVNQPGSMHFGAQAKRVGEMGDAERSSDSRPVIPASAHEGRAPGGDVICGAHMGAIHRFSDIQRYTDCLG